MKSSRVNHILSEVRKGHVGPNDAAIELMPYVEVVAKDKLRKYPNLAHLKDDMISEAYIGLVRTTRKATRKQINYQYLRRVLFSRMQDCVRDEQTIRFPDKRTHEHPLRNKLTDRPKEIEDKTLEDLLDGANLTVDEWIIVESKCDGHEDDWIRDTFSIHAYERKMDSIKSKLGELPWISN